MSQNRTLRGLTLVAGLWLTASAAAAAPRPAQAMGLGASALPPPAYVAFCERQPLDCGADAGEVLAEARRADAERAALFALLTPAAAAPSPSALSAAASETRAPEAAPAQFLPVEAPLEATVRPAVLRTQIDFVDAEARERAALDAAPPAMTPELWASLNRVNSTINHAIVEQSDARTYGASDYWTTPLENGRRYGDCEDYVLEKERALLAAGLPRQALNIAIVTTPWGESHAVLLVATGAGEFVLDNLSPWVSPWRETRYLWRQRQVNGDPFHWAMIEDPELTRAVKALAAQRAAAADHDGRLVLAQQP